MPRCKICFLKQVELLPRMQPCRHKICLACLETWTSTCQNQSKVPTCPFCRQEICDRWLVQVLEKDMKKSEEDDDSHIADDVSSPGIPPELHDSLWHEIWDEILNETNSTETSVPVEVPGDRDESADDMERRVAEPPAPRRSPAWSRRLWRWRQRFS